MKCNAVNHKEITFAMTPWGISGVYKNIYLELRQLLTGPKASSIEVISQQMSQAAIRIWA